MSANGKRHVTLGERQRILSACRASEHPDLHLAALLARETGCGPVEILGLRWRNIGLFPGSASIQFPRMNHGYREMPVGDLAANLLLERRKPRRSEWVFPVVSRDAASKLRAAWRAALTEAQVAHFPLRKYAAHVDSSWDWVLNWTEVVPPDHLLRLSQSQPTAHEQPSRRATRCMLSDATTLSGRDFVVRSDDLIPYDQCKSVLVENWQATDEEIAIWVMHGHISIFERDLTAVETTKQRGIHHNIPGYAIEEELLSTGAEAHLLSFRFDVNEIELFDPCPDQDMLDIRNEYDGQAFNPSGRFLTFDQAVGFLGRYASSVSPEAVLRDAFKEKRIEAFHYGAWLIQPNKTPGMFGGYYPTIEQAVFAESVIISLARSELKLGTGIKRWDAASGRATSTAQVGKEEKSDRSSSENSDAVLGRKVRKQRADMAMRRHVEQEATDQWWAPFIQERDDLISSGKAGNKSHASRLVKNRHPEAGINWGTLRQK